MRNAAVLIVVAAVVFLMLLAGRHFHNGASAAAIQGSGQGAIAPDFTLKTVDGKELRLSDLRGKAVVLNFWATWCPPCKIEIPWFEDLQKQYASQGLVILGVAMDDNAKSVVPPFVQKMDINYPVVFGTDQVADEYGGVEGLPTTFYIGRDGKIVKTVAGLVSHHEIEENIKAALNSGVNNTPHTTQATVVPQVAN